MAKTTKAVEIGYAVTARAFHGFTATAEGGSTLFVDLAGERVAVRCVGAHAPQSPPALLTMDEADDLIAALTEARAALG